MIKSMTAYARAEKKNEKTEVIVEIRAYNSRFLDIVLRIPSKYHVFEEKVKSKISEKISRGRIEIMIQIKDEFEQTIAFDVDIPKAQSYYNALINLKNILNINSEIPLDFLVKSGDLIKPVDVEKDLESNFAIIQDCIDFALIDLDIMRKKEGEFISRDFSERIKFIEKSIDKIESESKDIAIDYQLKLKERIVTLTKGIIDIDLNRIAQEAAILADRSDISEEIVRAKSHIEQFRNFINSDESAGRKINFLLQEINREVNTMGTKAGNAKISHVIVDIKAELEKLREQVQNIE